jgi:hypothetical protein
MPYLDEYIRYFSLAPGVDSAQELYGYLKGTSAYADWQAPRPGYAQNARRLQQQAIRQYGVETDLALRKMHTAMAYRQLSADLAGQAADLSDAVNREGSWSLLGTGDLWSDLLAGDSPMPELALPGLGDMIRSWAGEIHRKIQGGGLFDSKSEGQKSDQVQDLVGEKMGSFDFFGLLDSVLGAVEALAAPPEYTVRIEKKGLRLSTGERIEVQAAALDNLMQSLDLQLQSDELLTEAIRHGPHQQQVDAAYQHALFRRSLIRIGLD